MSDDLISRKVLMKNAKDYFISPDGALRLIEGQPTAYDVDKVVEEIREYADSIAEMGGNFLPKVVIEIVKSGGVADD